MATQPHPQPPPRPTPPQPPPKPEPKPEAGKAARSEPLTIGAKPTDPKDPQAVKFEPPQSAPPRWDEHPKEIKPAPDWTPEPALDPRAEKAPEGAYVDGMPIAQEQRLRSAWMEQEGMAKYDEATDQRPDDEKPKFNKDALAGGGAFVTAGTQRQVPGVVPPTKRE